MMKTPTAICLLILTAFLCQEITAGDVEWDDPQAGNPVMPGYFADPSIVEYQGRYYLYATIDSWGGPELGLWESEDFVNWQMHRLNWPTKEACTSSTSHGSMVWAPAVVQGPDGRFYMYVSVGSEIWAGVAEHPTGPWQNALQTDEPLIRCQQEQLNIHTIDADCFIDDDGRIWLYWGSGWDYKDGRCLVAELDTDMVTFISEFKDITPEHYFEGPHMIKRNGQYYLMYSDGRVYDDSYAIYYSRSDSPTGPFELGPNNPLLVSDRPRNIFGPGHHWVLNHGRQDYIVYHRHSIPYQEPMTRQICIDELNYDDQGNMLKITPTHRGIGPLGTAESRQRDLAAGKRVRACCHESNFQPAYIVNDNYATRWQAKPGNWPCWVEIDLGQLYDVEQVEIEFEYPYLPYSYKVEYADEQDNWQLYSDRRDEPRIGSPHRVSSGARARYLRVTVFQTPGNEHPASIWRVRVY